MICAFLIIYTNRIAYTWCLLILRFPLIDCLHPCFVTSCRGFPSCIVRETLFLNASCQFNLFIECQAINDWKIIFGLHCWELRIEGLLLRPSDLLCSTPRVVLLNPNLRACRTKVRGATMFQVNSPSPEQNGHHFVDIFKRIFANKKCCNSIQISLTFRPNCPIDNKPALVQVMAWRRISDKSSNISRLHASWNPANIYM